MLKDWLNSRKQQLNCKVLQMLCPKCSGQIYCLHGPASFGYDADTFSFILKPFQWASSQKLGGIKFISGATKYIDKVSCRLSPCSLISSSVTCTCRIAGKTSGLACSPAYLHGLEAFLMDAQSKRSKTLLTWSMNANNVADDDAFQLECDLLKVAVTYANVVVELSSTTWTH